MFGEIPLYGNKTIVSDGKGRIALPAFTNSEIGENMIVRTPEISEYQYEITTVDEFDAEVKILDELIASELNESKRNKYIIRKLKLCSSVLSTVSVTSGNRITGFEKDTAFKVVGFRKSLLLKKDYNSIKK